MEAQAIEQAARQARNREAHELITTGRRAAAAACVGACFKRVSAQGQLRATAHAARCLRACARQRMTRASHAGARQAAAHIAVTAKCVVARRAYVDVLIEHGKLCDAAGILGSAMIRQRVSAEYGQRLLAHRAAHGARQDVQAKKEGTAKTVSGASLEQARKIYGQFVEGKGEHASTALIFRDTRCT